MENEQQDRTETGIDELSSSSDRVGSAVNTATTSRVWRPQLSPPMMVWFCLAMFQVGLLWGFWGFFSADPAGNDEETLIRENSDNQPASDRRILNALRTADYQKAQDLLDSCPDNQRNHYLRALADEGLLSAVADEEAKRNQGGSVAPKKYKATRAKYHEITMLSNSATPETGAAIWVGLGRVDLREVSLSESHQENQPHEHDLVDWALCDIVLGSGHPERAKRAITADALSLLAGRLYALGNAETSKVNRERPFEIPGIPQVNELVRYVADWIPESTDKETLSSSDAGALDVSVPDKVSGIRSFDTVKAAIDDWEEKTAWSVDWGNNEGLDAESKPVRLHLHEMPREVFLTCLLYRRGLTWHEDETDSTTIKITQISKDDPQQRKFINEHVEQLLDFAVTAQLPGTLLGDWIRLHLAREIYRCSPQTKVADHILSALCSSFANRISPQAASAYYHRGLILEELAREEGLKLEELAREGAARLAVSSECRETRRRINPLLDDALKSYYHVLENWPPRQLKLKTEFALGRLLLQTGDPDKMARVRSALQRVATDDGALVSESQRQEMSLTRGRAAVLNAMTYLDEKVPQTTAARQLVELYHQDKSMTGRENKELLAVAGLVSALAIFPESPGPNNHVDKLEDLKHHLRTAVVQLQSNRQWLGQFGDYWIAEAYQKLGVPTAAIAVYEETLSRSPNGVWSEKMRRKIIQHYELMGDFVGARKQFARLVSEASDDRKRVVEIQRVNFYLKEEKDKDWGHWDQCLTWSQQLYDTASSDDKEEMLRLMGRVYFKMEYFDEARQCYNGQVPADPRSL